MCKEIVYWCGTVPHNNNTGQEEEGPGMFASRETGRACGVVGQERMVESVGSWVIFYLAAVVVWCVSVGCDRGSEGSCLGSGPRRSEHASYTLPLALAKTSWRGMSEEQCRTTTRPLSLLLRRSVRALGDTLRLVGHSK